MGRPRKNVDSVVGGITKAEREFRKEQERKINGDLDKWEVPTFLKGDKVAIKEFKRLSEELKNMEVLSNIDNITLGLYCQCFSNYVECVKQEREHGLFIEYTNKNGSTNLQEAPWVKLRRQLETQMVNIAKQFGFTPKDRLSFIDIKPKQEEKDELLDILNS